MKFQIRGKMIKEAMIPALIGFGVLIFLAWIEEIKKVLS